MKRKGFSGGYASMPREEEWRDQLRTKASYVGSVVRICSPKVGPQARPTVLQEWTCEATIGPTFGIPQWTLWCSPMVPQPRESDSLLGNSFSWRWANGKAASFKPTKLQLWKPTGFWSKYWLDLPVILWQTMTVQYSTPIGSRMHARIHSLHTLHVMYCNVVI